MGDRHADAMRVSIFAHHHPISMPTPNERARLLADNLALFEAARKRRPTAARRLLEDKTLQALVADLIAARVAVGMTQEDVAARMFTKKSVVSRLESGSRTRPTLSTIEKYARAVGAVIEIRVQPQR